MKKIIAAIIVSLFAVTAFAATPAVQTKPAKHHVKKVSHKHHAKAVAPKAAVK